MNSEEETATRHALFTSIMQKDADGSVYYKSQQIGEEELSKTQKVSILQELFTQKPHIFLERYHQHIEQEFLPLFDATNPDQNFYLHLIQTQNGSNSKSNAATIRNRRYLAMQALRKEGSYFSNEKMREREPNLFDLMVSPYLDDSEKLHLRPTIEVNDSNRSEFSRLLEQFDETQRIADRKERFLENYRRIVDNSDSTDRFISHVSHRFLEEDEEEREIHEQEAEQFQMEFDSSDEEGKEAEAHRQKAVAAKKREEYHSDFKKKMDKLAQNHQQAVATAIETKAAEDVASEALSSMHVSKPQSATNPEEECGGEPEAAAEWSSGDEDEQMPTGYQREQLYAEFVSVMEERFLDGKDAEFFDYSAVDSGQQIDDKILDQDMEDEYFDSEEPDWITHEISIVFPQGF